MEARWGLALLGGMTMAASSDAAMASTPARYPKTERIAVHDTLHGVALVDDYRWLEEGKASRVAEWVAEQMSLTRAYLDSLPQRERVVARLNELWRYDDESIPRRVLAGERVFVWRKAAVEEKWSLHMRERDGSPTRVVLDPNTWPLEETLAGATTSRDGRRVAFAKDRGGSETPVVRVLDVDRGTLLPDSVGGWKQYVECWLPDGSGFYYTAKPKPGTVPAGEENFWHAVYEHRLGEPSAADRRLFGDDRVKEYYHGAEISENGRFVAFYRWNFSRNELFIRALSDSTPPTPIAVGFDGKYAVTFADDRILVLTDARNPMGEVYAIDLDRPQREQWRVFIPADDHRKLDHVRAVGGHVYAVYEDQATTRVRIYDGDGRYVRDLPLPPLGNGYVDGEWSRDDVWVQFSSFIQPPTIFKYDFAMDSLRVHRAFPVPVDVSAFAAEQVWFRSTDETPVSMFLLHRGDLVQDGSHPALLSGYGGFDASIKPYFSAMAMIWLEAGGVVALPNLRGGGEYGRGWHEAGMREKKQNVFDDFIAAAEWLLANRYTSPERLAIRGGSNGGLLVGAVTAQRPELFRAVDCEVPLLDMIRYHRFGLANIWAEEYGSAENPEQFRYLLAYSPYHNIVDGRAYPAMLLTCSENDARVDPLHARKMAARMQAANPDGHIVLLNVQTASGHGGGTTLSTQIGQTAASIAFLMNELDMPSDSSAVGPD